MVLAMRQGVLSYEAVYLNRLFINFPFGVFIYPARRTKKCAVFSIYAAREKR